MNLLVILNPALYAYVDRVDYNVNHVERQMLEEAKQDTARFALLYERYLPRIYGYCLRRTENREEAEDLSSQVFIRVMQGVHTYNGGMVSAWLFRIAHNVVVNHYRSKRKTISIEHVDLPSEIRVGNDLEAEEDQRILAELIHKLPEDKRNLLALILDGGLTSDEVGEVLGKSAGAVRVEFHRIVKTLRKQYMQVTGA